MTSISKKRILQGNYVDIYDILIFFTYTVNKCHNCISACSSVFKVSKFF